MRKRNIQKIVRFNRKEAQDLAAKAKKACLSEAGLIRLLIRGYEPKEKPDDRFYDVMRELSSIGNNINQLAAKANTLGFIDAPMLKNEAAKWNKFQSEIERTYLRPNQSEMKWQNNYVVNRIKPDNEQIYYIIDCPFVLWVGKRRMIKRELFDEYIEKMYEI